jgi:hypothetical protein
VTNEFILNEYCMEPASQEEVVELTSNEFSEVELSEQTPDQDISELTKPSLYARIVKEVKEILMYVVTQ